MSAYTNFRVNTDNALGFEYDEYKSKLYQLALTNTKDYFALRNAVYSNIKKGMIKQLYNTFFNLMTSGALTNPNGTPAKDGSAIDGSNVIFDFVPNYPEDEVNTISLKAARTLEILLKEALDIIIPKDYYQLAEDRARQKSDLQKL
jgi:hypothetical protein